MEKAEIRREMIARRLGLEAGERERRAAAAQDVVVGSPWFAGAGRVAIYHAFRGEVGTERIAAAALDLGKRLALPRVRKSPRALWLHEVPGAGGAVEPDDGQDQAAGLWAGLAPGPFGLQEPDPAWPRLALGEVDLVVVPGVAFDPTGHRLGYGAGYYDRMLAELRAQNPTARMVGLAYEIQVIPSLPSEPHDVPLDGLATETGLRIFSRR